MKKIIILLSVITAVFIVNDLSKEEVIIPKESIRLRVIANSDSTEDQALKQKVKEKLNKNIEELLTNSKNIEDTRMTLKKNIPLFENTINTTLKENNTNIGYDINYGENYFPEKNYKNVTYKEGNYESLVVKIGKGQGKNFWCVLFPPLCFIDEQQEKNKEVEYHVLVKDILNKFSKNKIKEK